MPVPRLATVQTGPGLSLVKQMLAGNPDCAPNRSYAYRMVARIEVALEGNPFPQARAANT